MHEHKCGECQYWAQTSGEAKDQRGAVLLEEGGQQVPQGECRKRALHVQVFVTPQGLGTWSGYPQCKGDMPGCGEFERKELSPFREFINGDDGPIEVTGLET